MEHDTLDDLGFSLDLINLANGLGCHNAQCGPRPNSPEGEELEAIVRDVLASTDEQSDGAAL